MVATPNRLLDFDESRKYSYALGLILGFTSSQYLYILCRFSDRCGPLADVGAELTFGRVIGINQLNFPNPETKATIATAATRHN
jgi:hypothetical protein